LHHEEMIGKAGGVSLSKWVNVVFSLSLSLSLSLLPSFFPFFLSFLNPAFSWWRYGPVPLMAALASTWEAGANFCEFKANQVYEVLRASQGYTERTWLKKKKKTRHDKTYTRICLCLCFIGEVSFILSLPVHLLSFHCSCVCLCVCVCDN
jgi:hypothetical protein